MTIYHNIMALCRERFVVDLRSLAAGRIGLGAALLIDLYQRFHLLQPLFAGDLVVEEACSRISLFCWCPEGTWASALLVCFALAAAALVLGIHAAPAAFVALVLKVSLHVRLPMVQNGGDLIAVNLLFFATFLPTAHVWSVEAWHARRKGELRANGTHGSAATCALGVQIACIYAIAAALKSPKEWLLNATAVRDAFLLETYASEIAVALRQFPDLLALGSRSVYLFEGFAGVTLAIGGSRRIRTIVILALIAMHVAFGLTFRIGVFSLVCIAGLLMILPSDLPPTPAARATRFGRFLTFVTILVVLQNLTILPPLRRFGGPFHAIGAWTGLRQGWGMFAPAPPRLHGYVSIAGTRADGSTYDVLTGGSVTVPERFPLTAAFDPYPSEYWRRFLAATVYPAHRSPPWALARYLCKGLGPRRDDPPTRLAVDVVEFETLLDGRVEGPRLREVLRYDCPPR